MAEIKIAAELWDKLTDHQKGKIEGILLASGSMKSGDTIMGDASIAHDPAMPAMQPFGLGIPGVDDVIKAACKAACAAAAATAATACAGITDGIASAACYAAAAAAAEECGKRC